MDRLKELAIAQKCKLARPWFGSDVGQSSNRKAGIMADGAHDFTSSMDIQLTQDKAGRLDYSESLTHAVLTRDLDENGKARNGRSKAPGRKGW